jgi:membrane protease YdiL (CAAX protease family)
MIGAEGGAGPPSRPARPRVRWGLPDVAIAWIAGLVVSVIAGAIAIAIGDVPSDAAADDVGVLLASVVGQAIGIIGALGLISWRKGRGSLRADFGLLVRARDWAWLAAGVGLQIVSTLALLPIVELHGKEDAQEVVKQFEDARGFQVVLFSLVVVLVAPLAEELLFRGALLRALLRRTTPAWSIFGSALVFALVHPASSPTIGSVMAVPALLALGVVSANLAVRTGNLSASILLHAGFNLLTAIVVSAR